MKEDLLMRILRSVICMLSLVFGLLYMLSPGKFRANYYMCLGEDPRKDSYDHGKVTKKIYRVRRENLNIVAK